MRTTCAWVTLAAASGLVATTCAGGGDTDAAMTSAVGATTESNAVPSTNVIAPDPAMPAGTGEVQPTQSTTPGSGMPSVPLPAPASSPGTSGTVAPVVNPSPEATTSPSSAPGDESVGDEPVNTEPVVSSPPANEPVPASPDATAPPSSTTPPVEMETPQEPLLDVDQNGKLNAAVGESTSGAQDYLRLGEIRILNNNWGSAERGCDTQMSVFVDQDRSFGWKFDRGACGGDGSQPDFPQVEFGIHPFGIGNPLVTSPEFSSTTLLPAQIKDLASVGVNVDNLRISLQAQQSWNITMEFWLSERDPVNDPNPGVYAEVMTFWGWQAARWACDNEDNHNVQSGGKSYKLCHQRDDWANGQWRYYQFRAGDGTDGNSSQSFSGDVDVKAFLDYLVNERGYSPELWVTRLEVGSEIDDNTSGEVRLDGITFEVNGERRSDVIAE